MAKKVKPLSAKQLAALADSAISSGHRVTRCPTAASAYTTGASLEADLLKQAANEQTPLSLAKLVSEGIREFQKRRDNKHLNRSR